MLSDPSVRLREAIIEGNLLIVKRLLRRFPDLLTNINSSNGWSSLHYASYHGRYLICVLLIQMGHDKQEILTTFEGDTCVHLALMNGYEQTTHLLLQHFPNFINRKGNFGRTPAHIACMHDYHQCLSLLIGVGATLYLPDDNGDTPLHICLEFGSVSCMRLLVLEVETPDDQIKNHDNWRPSDVAMTFDLQRDYKQLLKDAKKAHIPRNKSLQSFKTPVLTTKATFDDGPSPILSMNSPSVSLFSQSNMLPSFVRMTSAARANNVGASGKSPIPRSTSFTSMLATVDTSLKTSNLTTPISPTNKKEMYNSFSPLDKFHTESRSSTASPQKNEHDYGSEKPNDVMSPLAEINSSSNTNLFGRYLNSNNNNENENPFVADTPEPSRAATAESLSSSSTENTSAMPRRKISLLNIPVSKVRHEQRIGEQDTIN